MLTFTLVRVLSLPQWWLPSDVVTPQPSLRAIHA